MPGSPHAYRPSARSRNPGNWTANRTDSLTGQAGEGIAPLFGNTLRSVSPSLSPPGRSNDEIACSRSVTAGGSTARTAASAGKAPQGSLCATVTEMQSEWAEE